VTAGMPETGERERPPDPGVVQRRASHPATSVWVGASAGTGKTKVLTDRVLRLMLAGTAPDKILCLTFTKAAAAEMANRINTTLVAWATAADEDLERALATLTGDRPDRAARDAARRLFARVLDAPGGMKIQTIHAFCQSLLRRFPVEADLPPHFALLEERTAAELMAEARDGLFADPGAARPTLARITAEVEETRFEEVMGALAAERGRLRRLIEAEGGVAAVDRALRVRHGVADVADDAAVLAEACAERAFDRDGLRRAAGALAAGTQTDREKAAAIAGWLARGDAAARAEGWDDYGRAFLTKDGVPYAKPCNAGVAKADPDVPDVLAGEAARLVRTEERRRAVATADATAALVTVGHALIARYEALKAGRALMDYDDLILRTVELLSREGVAPWVLFKLDGGLDHVLIDEAQDTNPDQWRVVDALTEEFFAGEGAHDGPRTVFAVGDRKQSIFSFQRADPTAFERQRRGFAERVTSGGQRWDEVALDISFRSTAPVLSLVDAVFARDPARPGVAGPDDPPVAHRPHRRGQAGLVELWPPVGPEDDGPAPEAWTPPVDQRAPRDPARRLAETIAATVRGWLDAGERLAARDRPVTAGDILVLVRTRTVFFTMLVAALKRRGVEVAGVDRMRLTEPIAVQDLIALGRFLLLPEDDLTLAALLKAPFLGLDEAALFDLAHGRDGSLWRALGEAARDAPDGRPAAAHAWLAALLSRADFEPPHALFARVLARPCPADPVSARRAILARLGDEAEDPIDEFLGLTLAFEKHEPPSLERFLHWLVAGEAEVKRETETGAPRLRIMTVHGAKGLQAPIVILPDTMGRPDGVPPILWHGAEHAGERALPIWHRARDRHDAIGRAAYEAAAARRDEEYRRLLYVALTRAEDRLYVAGFHGPKRPKETWYDLVAAGMADLDHAPPRPFAAWPGDVLRYEMPGRELVDKTIRDAERAAIGAQAADTTGPHEDLVSGPPRPEPDPPRPLAPSHEGPDETPVRAPLGPDDGARFRRGLLIHRLLESLPDLPADRRAEAARRFLARPGHGLPAEAREEIARQTLRLLDDPAFADLFGPDSRAEVPVTGRVGRRVVSGQVDRLVVREDAVLVVDYKTNRPPPEREADVPAAYLSQMAAYRAVLSAIFPDRPVRCHLLWTDRPRLMQLSDAALAEHAP